MPPPGWRCGEDATPADGLHTSRSVEVLGTEPRTPRTTLARSMSEAPVGCVPTEALTPRAAAESLTPRRARLDIGQPDRVRVPLQKRKPQPRRQSVVAALWKPDASSRTRSRSASVNAKTATPGRVPVRPQSSRGSRPARASSNTEKASAKPGEKAAWANAVWEQSRRAEAARETLDARRAQFANLLRRKNEAEDRCAEHIAGMAEAEASHAARMASLAEREADVKAQLAEAMKTIALEEERQEIMLKGAWCRRREIEKKESRIVEIKEQEEARSSEHAELVQRVVQLREEVRQAQERHDQRAELLARNVVFARKLHNEYLSLKGNIRVFCRLKPSLPNEEDDLVRTEIEGEESTSLMVHSAPQRSATGGVDRSSSWAFSFDHVFGPTATQAAIFEEIMLLVQSALDGYKVAIFAYGQTGSGKTHTMEGPVESLRSAETAGVIPRTVDLIFKEVSALEFSGWHFEVHVSMLEVYNEAVNDLLARPGDAVRARSASRDVWTARDETEQRPECNGRRVLVKDAAAVHTLMRRAARERHTAATDANDRSSRSHAVFQLSLSGHGQVGGSRREVEGLLSLVDLAGSERLEKSGATGDRLKETQHINRSLSALGDVIEALARRGKGGQHGHVPYRNSKLTMLLKESLGGDSKALMFVNVSQAANNLGETLSSLRFAAKVHGCNVGVASKHCS